MFCKKYKKTVIVDGISCEHCVKKITTSLKNIDNVKKVKVDIKKKEVTIISNKQISNDTLTDTISNLDYKVIGIKERI